MPLEALYDLRRDGEGIERIQRATLTEPGFGLQPKPALFGSEDWWAAVGTERLPLHLVSGTISRVYWGSMGDWPEFALTSDDASETTWTRVGDISRYVEGLRTEVDFVLQWFKEDSFAAQQGMPLETKVVVAIRVEQSDRRSDPRAPGPGGIGLRRPPQD
jgi:hypothetical protein